MFYSHNILQKKGGRFGKIWIAATRSSKLTKREYVTINVANTCQDIINCLQLQVEPRLSLYLSSQLMFGVVRVFYKQCEYLTNELIYVNNRIGSRINIADSIDIGISRERHTIPEGSRDQTFGNLQHISLPITIPEQDILLPSATSTDESPGRRQPDAIPSHLSPPDLITLREDVSDMETIQVPVEEEIAQDPAFAEVMHQVTAAINRLETDEEREEGIMLVEEETGQLSLSRDHQRKTRDRKRKRGLPEPEPILPPDDVVHSPNFPSVNEIASITDDIPLRVTQLDDIEQIVPRPPPEETPRTDKAVAPPNLELSPIVEIIPPVVRRRKRSLFVDQETQLHKTDMRHNMATSGDLCKKNDIISIPKHPSARELFNLPTRVGMRKSKPMMAIWKRHAVPCDYESPSEYENQIWSTIYLREMASDEDNTRELSDIERIRRTMTESRSLLLTDLTSLSETRERDADRFSSSLARPLTTNSIEEVPRELEMAEQQQTEFDPIPEHILGETGRELGSSSDEVPIELVPEQQIELDDIRYGQRDIRELDTVTVHEEKIALADLLNGSEQSFARDISNLMEDGSVTFLELCPYTTYRQAVARMFYVCLVLCEKGVIQVSQPEFYGTITIERGPNFPLF